MDVFVEVLKTQSEITLFCNTPDKAWWIVIALSEHALVLRTAKELSLARVHDHYARRIRSIYASYKNVQTKKHYHGWTMRWDYHDL